MKYFLSYKRLLSWPGTNLHSCLRHVLNASGVAVMTREAFIRCSVRHPRDQTFISQGQCYACKVWEQVWFSGVQRAAFPTETDASSGKWAFGVVTYLAWATCLGHHVMPGWNQNGSVRVGVGLSTML